MSQVNDITCLEGAIVTSITGAEIGSGEVLIVTNIGALKMWHEQDCCESVTIEDVTGNPADLVGAEVILAEQRDSPIPKDHKPGESETWTFYEIRTTKGDLTLRWLGESNGYYSEHVTCEWTP